MKYTIYKITNKLNGKQYIGKHITSNVEDGYMGSGKHLKRAIEKYGIENFTKEIVYIFNTEDEMNRKEAELVTEEYCNRNDTYNICPGGQGGWGYINKTIMEGEKRLEHNRKYTKFGDKEWRSKNVDPRKGGYAAAPQTSERMKRLHKEGKAYFGKGAKHSDETKRKIGAINSLHQQGKNNSQYGTCWITNGIENKKIKKEDLDKWTSLGYNKGRKF
jgi:hypothetical protein